jgi:probable rRNA maturation factor
MPDVTEHNWVLLSEKGGNTPVSLGALNSIASRAFDITGQEGGEISLMVCDDRFIEELNRTYRKKRRPTDVLSFPLRVDERRSSGASPLGDIVISSESVKRQARKESSGFEREFLYLFTHGLLHLLGYTHDQRQEKERMYTLTDTILEGVSHNR